MILGWERRDDYWTGISVPWISTAIRNTGDIWRDPRHGLSELVGPKKNFKQAVRTIGAYAYHFWMKSMIPLRKRAGDQFMHKQSEQYRRAVRRKLDAYHRFIQVGLIAQGLLQYLSVSFPDLVWAKFNSYIRTIRPGIPPSEYVTSLALRNCLPDFLSGSLKNTIFTKFLLDRIDFRKSKALRMAA